MTLVVGDEEVMILFAANADSAVALQPEHGVLRGQRGHMGNVVLAWETVPGAAVAQAVEACIR